LGQDLFSSLSNSKAIMSQLDKDILNREIRKKLKITNIVRRHTSGYLL